MGLFPLLLLLMSCLLVDGKNADYTNKFVKDKADFVKNDLYVMTTNDCPRGIIKEKKLNVYNRDVVSLFVKDADGIEASKKVYHAGKSTSLHGFWPKDRCVGSVHVGDIIRENDDYGKVLIDNQNQLKKWISLNDIDKVWIPQSEAGNIFRFYIREVTKHWFNNNYDFKSFKVTYDMFFNPGYEGNDMYKFSVHQCRYDKKNKKNFVEVIVIGTNGSRHNCNGNEDYVYPDNAIDINEVYDLGEIMYNMTIKNVTKVPVFTSYIKQAKERVDQFQEYYFEFSSMKEQLSMIFNNFLYLCIICLSTIATKIQNLKKKDFYKQYTRIKCTDQYNLVISTLTVCVLLLSILGLCLLSINGHTHILAIITGFYSLYFVIQAIYKLIIKKQFFGLVLFLSILTGNLAYVFNTVIRIGEYFAGTLFIIHFDYYDGQFSNGSQQIFYGYNINNTREIFEQGTMSIVDYIIREKILLFFVLALTVFDFCKKIKKHMEYFVMLSNETNIKKRKIVKWIEVTLEPIMMLYFTSIFYYFYECGLLYATETEKFVIATNNLNVPEITLLVLLIIVNLIDSIFSFTPSIQRSFELTKFVYFLINGFLFKKEIYIMFQTIVCHFTQVYNEMGCTIEIIAAVSLLVVTFLIRTHLSTLTPWLVITQMVLIIPVIKLFHVVPFTRYDQNLQKILNLLNMDDYYGIYICVVGICLCSLLNYNFRKTPIEVYRNEDGDLKQRSTIIIYLKNLLNSVGDIVIVFYFMALVTLMLLPILRRYVKPETETFSIWAGISYVCCLIFFMYSIYLRVNYIYNASKLETKTYYKHKVCTIVYWSLSTLSMLVVAGCIMYSLVCHHAGIKNWFVLVYSIIPYVVTIILFQIVIGLIMILINIIKRWSMENPRYIAILVEQFLSKIVKCFSTVLLMTKLMIFFGCFVHLIPEMKFLTLSMASTLQEIFFAMTSALLYFFTIVVALEFILNMDNWFTEYLWGNKKIIERKIYKRPDDIVNRLHRYLTDQDINDFWEQIIANEPFIQKQKVKINHANENKSEALKYVNTDRGGVHLEVDSFIETLRAGVTGVEISSEDAKVLRVDNNNYDNFISSDAQFLPEAITEYHIKDDILQPREKAYCITQDDFNLNGEKYLNNAIYFPAMTKMDDKIKIKKMMICSQALNETNPEWSLQTSKAAEAIMEYSKTFDPISKYKEIVVDADIDFDYRHLFYPITLSYSLIGWLCTLVRGLIENSAEIMKFDLTLQPNVTLANYIPETRNNDDFYTLEEFMYMTDATISQIRNSCEKKEITVVVNKGGKIFVTKDETMANALCNECVDQQNKTTGFGIMTKHSIGEMAYVRPSKIESSYTLSSGITYMGLKYQLPPGSEVLYCPDFDLYIHDPIHQYNNYKTTINEFTKNHSSKVIGSIAMSTGSVFVKNLSTNTNTRGYVGSCCVIRYQTGKLGIITNKHVVSGTQLKHEFFVDKKRNIFTTHKNMEAYFTMVDKNYSVPMEKCIAVGDDYALFEIDNKSQKYMRSLMQPIGERDCMNCFPKLRARSEKSGIFVSATRQSDRTIDLMNKITLRNVAVIWNNAGHYDILGYTTYGLSGSPIFSIENDEVELYGLNSAVEDFNNLKIHTTRIIDGDKIYASVQKFLNRTQIDLHENCVLPSMLDKLDERIQKTWDINLCNYEIGVGFKKEHWPNIKNGVIYCGMNSGKQDEVRAYKYFGHYNEDYLIQDELNVIDHEQLKEIFNTCAVIMQSETVENQNYLPIDLNKLVLWNSDVNSLIFSVKNNQSIGNEKYTGFHFIDTAHFFDCKVVYVGNSLWKMSLDGEFWLTVDDVYVRCIFAAASVRYRRVDEILKNLISTGTVNKIYTMTMDNNNSMYYQSYSKEPTTNKVKKCMLNTIQKHDDDSILYVITDGDETMPITYTEFEKLKGGDIDFKKEIGTKIRLMKENKKVIIQKLNHLRRQYDDLIKSDEFVRRMSEFKKLQDEYKAEMDLYKDNVEKVKEIVQAHKDKLKQNEVNYLKTLNELRETKRVHVDKLNDVRKKLKEDEKEHTKINNDKITENQKLIQQLKQSNQELLAENKKIRDMLNNECEERKVLEKKIVELNNEIKKISTEREESNRELRNQIREMQPAHPKKVDIISPIKDPQVVKIQEEMQFYRGELKNINKKIEELHKDLEIAPNPKLECLLNDVKLLMTKENVDYGEIQLFLDDMIESTKNTYSYVARRKKNQKQMDEQLNDEKDKLEKEPISEYDQEKIKKYQHEKTTLKSDEAKRKKKDQRELEDELQRERDQRVERPESEYDEEPKYRKRKPTNTSWADMLEEEYNYPSTSSYSPLPQRERKTVKFEETKVVIHGRKDNVRIRDNRPAKKEILVVSSEIKNKKELFDYEQNKTEIRNRILRVIQLIERDYSDDFKKDVRFKGKEMTLIKFELTRGNIREFVTSMDEVFELQMNMNQILKRVKAIEEGNVIKTIAMYVNTHRSLNGLIEKKSTGQKWRYDIVLTKMPYDEVNTKIREASDDEIPYLKRNYHVFDKKETLPPYIKQMYNTGRKRANAPSWLKNFTIEEQNADCVIIVGVNCREEVLLDSTEQENHFLYL